MDIVAGYVGSGRIMANFNITLKPLSERRPAPTR